MTETPSALVIKAMNCAWMSVGKPGNGRVVTSTARTRPVAVGTLEMRSVPISRSAPAACSRSSTAIMCCGRTSVTVTGELVINAPVR